jgi:lipopolysaccharide O-acetyltransferase
VDFGVNLSIGVGFRLEAFPNGINSPSVVFGNNVQLNDYVHIVAMNNVTIGNNVLMASHIFISDNSHGSYKGDENDSNPEIAPIKRDYPTSPIIIGDNSWICEGVMIMPGTTIGRGCIIGAHSIVRGSIPDYSIAVGNPAKVVKRYNFDSNRWERV